MSSLRRLLTAAVHHDARHTDRLPTDGADRLDPRRSWRRHRSSDPAHTVALDPAAARARHDHASTLLSLR